MSFAVESKTNSQVGYTGIAGARNDAQGAELSDELVNDFNLFWKLLKPGMKTPWLFCYPKCWLK